MNTRDNDSSIEPAPGSTIELHLREVRQLFDALDPSPFREKDLDRNAEEYIVESVKELHSRRPGLLLIHLDQSTGLPEEEQAVTEAIHVHFARRSNLLKRALHRLLHRGTVSLGIGLAFLVVLFAIGRLAGELIGENTATTLIQESLLIAGWVAMWRPLEIFLYDWWPILGEQRLHRRLSQIPVRIVPGNPRLPNYHPR